MPANPPPSTSSRLDGFFGIWGPGWWIGYVGVYTLSAISAAGVIFRVLQGRRSKQDIVVHVSVENLMASMVLMVAACDLLYDVLWLTWNINFAVDPGRLSRGYQRFIYVLTQLLMFTAHIMLAAHLHAWTVRRSSPAKLSQRFPRRFAIVILIILIVAGVLGFGVDPSQKNGSGNHCDAGHLAACYGYASMVFAPLSILAVGAMYWDAYRTVRTLLKRNLRSATPHPGLALISARIRDRLLKYTLLFMFNWGFDVVLLWTYLFTGDSLPHDGKVILRWLWNMNGGVLIPLSRLARQIRSILFLHMLLVHIGLAGFLDAMILGWRDANPGHLSSSRNVSQSGSNVMGSTGVGLSKTYTNSTSIEMEEKPATPMKDVPKVNKRLYCTSYNMGGIIASSLQQAQIQEWIPLGYDLYAIGVQECECVHEMTAAIIRHLGGTGAYRCFHSDIGDATILHGKIALLVFAKTTDVTSGAFWRVGTVQGKVHNGANLGFARAGNKGMVGLSFRFHDTTIAFINVHFAADKKGRSGTNKRLKDAVKTLQELVLVSEDTEFDCHFQCHHVVCLGDMNFRVQESSDWVLQEVGKSLRWELHYHKRQRNMNRNRGKEWREIRLGALRLNQLKKRSKGMEDEEEEDPSERDRFLAGAGVEETKTSSASNLASEKDEDEEEDDDENEDDLDEEDTQSIAVEWAHADEEQEQEMHSPPIIPESATKLMKSARAWSWLQECEELTVAMRETRAFYGFQEQVIRFPPSFKWKPGVDAHGFKDVASLPSYYKVQVKEGSKIGLRPPSYTDRVLVHSLPDKRRRIQLKAYDILERVVASDHRPVALALDLGVQPSIVGFEQLDKLGKLAPFKSEKVVCLCEISMTNIKTNLLDGQGSIREIRINYPVVAEDPLHTQRKILSLHDFINNDSTRHFGSLPTVPLTANTVGYTRSGVSATDSISSSGINSSQHSTRGPIASGSSAGTTSQYSSLPSVIVEGITTKDPAALRTMEGRLNDPSLLKSIHSFRWSDVASLHRRRPSDSLTGSSSRQGAGLRFATLAAPQFSTHALLKLVDGRGKDLGQGVVCLRDIIGRAAAKLRQLHAAAEHDGDREAGGHTEGGAISSSAGSESSLNALPDVIEPMSIDLSIGGIYVGVLQVDVSVKIFGQSSFLEAVLGSQPMSV